MNIEDLIKAIPEERMRCRLCADVVKVGVFINPVNRTIHISYLCHGVKVELPVFSEFVRNVPVAREFIENIILNNPFAIKERSEETVAAIPAANLKRIAWGYASQADSLLRAYEKKNSVSLSSFATSEPGYASYLRVYQTRFESESSDELGRFAPKAPPEPPAINYTLPAPSARHITLED